MVTGAYHIFSNSFFFFFFVGLTPQQALATATTTAASCLGVDGGKIEVGRWCDLVVLNANPLNETVLRQLNKDHVMEVVVGGKRWV